MPSVAILGGGLAGLAAAYFLQRKGYVVTIFEQTDRAGGVIQTERDAGFLVEYGPNSIRAGTPALERLIDELGISDLVLPANPAARKRYIVRDGALVPLPASPPGLIATRAFSLPGRLRLLLDLVIPPSDPAHDASVAQFVRRRFGAEALAYGANPFVAGIFAGDPARLSVRHAFPRLYALEQQHGSVLRGLFAQRKKQPESIRRGIFSFQEGVETLTKALASALEDRLRLATKVTGLEQKAGAWQIQREDAVADEQTFDAVISTLPLYAFAALDFDTTLDRAPLAHVPYAPVAVVTLGFRRSDVAHPLDGFGVLVPEAERSFRILGTIFNATVFPNRAPADQVLLTTLVGGTRHPQLVYEAPSTLCALVLDDLQRLLGVAGSPVFERHKVWEKAIPQYEVGYDAVKHCLARLEAAHPGLYFAGNYRDGISVPDTLDAAENAVLRLVGMKRET